MASHIAALGTLKYEGEGGYYVQFPGDSNTKISTRHVPTGDGRGIKYVEHTLTVEGLLFNSDLASATGTVDDAFDRAKQVLSQPAGRLTIVGKGWGDLYLNRDSGSNRDVLFGPFPEVIDWAPFGNVTCRFTWVVKFTVPWKKNAYTTGNILDYWWQTSYTQGADGFQSRTITGQLEIAGGRYNVGIPMVPKEHHIEQYYRQAIQVDCPLGMHRVQNDFQFDSSKTKVNFTIVDEPFTGFVYPPGIVDMDINHEMSSQNGDNTLANWTWVFTASATPDAGTHPIAAYQACVDAHQQRFLYMVRRVINSRSGVIIPIPVTFKISENAKRRSTSIVAVWSILAKGADGGQATFSPVDILSRGGLWQPFNWKAENYKSYADRQLGPNASGGFSQMVSDPNQNIIMDVSALVPFIPNPGKTTGNFKIGTTPNDALAVISPYGQYLEFKAWLSVKTEGNMWINFPLQKNNAGGVPQNFVGAEAIQKVSGIYNEYMLQGYIVRVGIPPAGVPKLAAINGLKCYVPSGKQVFTKTEPVHNVMGLILWKTSFMIPLTTERMDASNPAKTLDEGTGSRNKPADNLSMPDDKLVNVPPTINTSGSDNNNPVPE